jgi:hypothetical protein
MFHVAKQVCDEGNHRMDAFVTFSGSEFLVSFTKAFAFHLALFKYPGLNFSLLPALGLTLFRFSRRWKRLNSSERVVTDGSTVAAYGVRDMRCNPTTFSCDTVKHCVERKVEISEQ